MYSAHNLTVCCTWRYWWINTSLTTRLLHIVLYPNQTMCIGTSVFSPRDKLAYRSHVMLSNDGYSVSRGIYDHLRHFSPHHGCWCPGDTKCQNKSSRTKASSVMLNSEVVNDDTHGSLPVQTSGGLWLKLHQCHMRSWLRTHTSNQPIPVNNGFVIKSSDWNGSSLNKQRWFTPKLMLHWRYINYISYTWNSPSGNPLHIRWRY